MLSDKPWLKKGILILSALIALRIFFALLPYPALIEFRRSSYSLPLLDRAGRELFVYPLEEGLQRHKVMVDTIPKELQKIILKSEDHWFYFHLGVNPVSVLRTMITNHREGRIVSGASTITMQLARMITPRSKGIGGKVKEMWDAFRLEMKLSKREIFSLYLSHIPFGGNMEGYAAASRRLLGKRVGDLSPSELMVLTIVPRNPAGYDPVLYPGKLQEAVLRTFPQAKTSRIEIVLNDIAERDPLPNNPIEAPHFVQFVKRQLSLKDFQEGRPIYTTLNLELQKWAEVILRFYIDGARENRISNGALLLLQDGDILAYIGSGDFFDESRQGQIDGVQILRQPGSTLKPYLYELAMEMGFTAASVLPDVPMSFGNREVYRPENFSLTYHGPVRIRSALASSLNIPAVYMLQRIGVDNFIDRLKALGFNSLKGQEAKLGLGLAVGNAEVSLYELTRAFQSFKNKGIIKETRWNRAYKKDQGKQVMESPNAGIIRHILSDSKARVLGFGRRSVLNTPYPSYFKTGTSNQFNNIWALGATEDLTCGVWMGNFSGETVIGRPGSSLPALVVKKVLEEFSQKKDFAPLQKIESAQICSLSGGLLTPECSTALTEYFASTKELKPCDFHIPGGEVELPLEYSEWRNLYAYDRFGFTQGDAIEVLAPADGSVYYYTPEVPTLSQGVEIKIYGQGSFEIRLGGLSWLQGELPYEGIHTLERGDWEIEILTKEETVHRYIRVE